MTLTTSTPLRPEISTAVEAALERIYQHLGVDRRAWIIGGVLFTDTDDHSVDHTLDLTHLIETAFTSEDYPAIPFPFQPSQITWHHMDHLSVSSRRAGLGDDLQFDVVLGTNRRTWLGESMTRAVVDRDGTAHPTHVMLTDVEAVLADALSLGRSLAQCTGYRGSAALILDVVCRSTEAPLELRAFDESLGDTMRPAVGYDRFTPLQVPLQFPLTAEDELKLLWDLSRDIAAQFGVFEPQLIEHP